MKREIQDIRYDTALQIEAHLFHGKIQPFPNHFHDYYVIGIVEEGNRRLICRGCRYEIEKGDILFFAPGDSHSCAARSGLLHYRSLNIAKERMENLMRQALRKPESRKASGAKEKSGFPEINPKDRNIRSFISAPNVLRDKALFALLRNLHTAIFSIERSSGIQTSEAAHREKLLCAAVARLMFLYGCFRPFRKKESLSPEVERACAFIRTHFDEPLNLDRICAHTGLGKSSLLRSFVRQKDITPYRYLEAVRIDQAKKYLGLGFSPADTAQLTGFSDQSHLTNSFRSRIGLTPGMYRRIFTTELPAPDPSESPYRYEKLRKKP